METIALSDYILYGFLGFMCLLMVAIVVALWRQARDAGEMKGRISGLERQIDEMNGNLTGRVESLEQRLERLEQTVMTLAAELGEVKGLVLALHQKVDMLMRHRHDRDTGQVILTPEEVTAAG